MSYFSLLMVDDHPLFRDGLRAILHDLPGLNLLAEASSAEEALEKLTRGRFSVIITDLQLPQMNGIELIAEIRNLYREVPILVMSISSDSDDVSSAIRAGASGFLLKGSSREEVRAAVLALLNGQTYLNPQPRESALPAHSRRASLTEREQEILCLIAGGASSKEVAERLYLSTATVKTHLRALFRKLAVGSRTQLLMKASQLGLVELTAGELS